jgi:hypothetical protein
MKIQIKTNNAVKKEVGDIKRSPTLIRSHKKTKTKAAIFFIIGCVLGFSVAFGFSLFRNKESIDNIIVNDFTSSYTFNIQKIIEYPISAENIGKIQYMAEEAKSIFENSGVNMDAISGFVGKNARWFFQGGETLVLMSKNGGTVNDIKLFFYDIEGEIKKEFNISSAIYRNYEITQLMPAKNSRFNKSIFYTLDAKNDILISDNITFIRNVIDKMLD